MIKQVIRFVDGTYWKCYQHTTTDVKEAWTFNKVSGAEHTCLINGLTNYTIVPVEVIFALLA